MAEAINQGFENAYFVESIILRAAIMLCDMIGVLILLVTVGNSLMHYFHRDRHVKTMLAQGIALALEFKLAGEILRTVTIRDWNELVVLGTIIAMRGAITVLIHWEIKAERLEEAYERGLEKEAEIAAENSTKTESTTGK